MFRRFFKNCVIIIRSAFSEKYFQEHKAKKIKEYKDALEKQYTLYSAADGLSRLDKSYISVMKEIAVIDGVVSKPLVLQDCSLVSLCFNAMLEVFSRIEELEKKIEESKTSLREKGQIDEN